MSKGIHSLGGNQGRNSDVKSTTADNNDSDATFIHGREHTRVPSKKGKETYLYQPATKSSEDDQTDKNQITPEMAEFYQKIDTSTKFEIRRPKIRIGHLYNT